MGFTPTDARDLSKRDNLGTEQPDGQPGLALFSPLAAGPPACTEKGLIPVGDWPCVVFVLGSPLALRERFDAGPSPR